MTKDVNKPGVAFWATVALVVLLVALAIVWLSRPPEGILFDPIDIPSNNVTNGQ